MAGEDLRVERDGPVLVCTIDRPERHNALGADAGAALRDVWTSAAADPGIRALVLTGSGDRAFCTGMDLAENVGRGGVGIAATDVREAVRLTALQNGVWLPMIVAVNGVCAGGGLHFLADADVVVASERASFVDTHVAVGQVTAVETVGLLYRVGIGNVLRLAVLGREGRIGAADALRISLVDEVVPHDRLLDRALELAHAATRGSPAAIEASKRAIWAALDRPMSEALQHAWDAVRAHWSHPDCAEGPAAFAAKRDPRWQD